VPYFKKVIVKLYEKSEHFGGNNLNFIVRFSKRFLDGKEVETFQEEEIKCAKQ
jgi:hypothetical protein